MNEAPEQTSQNLCFKCKAIDFEQVFKTEEIPDTGKEILDIGKRPRSLNDLTCDLCRFFHTLGPQYFRKYSLHVRLFDRLKTAALEYPFFDNHLALPRRPFLTVLRKNSRLKYNSDISEELKQAGVVDLIPNGGTGGIPVRRVEFRIDYKPVYDQLQFCKTQHGGCGPRTAPPRDINALSHIYLIDCTQWKIIKTTLEEPYMALSYVWGRKAGPDSTSSSDTFSEANAPQTIKDAVRVVRNLGRNYLWVDRYCIDQDNAVEKEMMIGRMDEIYASAEATIIALYGDSDQSGLPGVSRTSREPQPRFATSHGTLVSSFPSLGTLVANSKWNTRGWTLQEALLSSRCLFFSHYQIYFVCKYCSWSEAVPEQPFANYAADLLNGSTLYGDIFGTKFEIRAGHYHDRLKYTMRQLTYPNDALNAFRGILRRSAGITLWGVPVKPDVPEVDPNSGLALGFLWIKRPHSTISRHLHEQTSLTSRRREGFPTWSWTSLEAHIYQQIAHAPSAYAKYLTGFVPSHPVPFPPPNEADIRFWIHIDGVPLSLPDALQGFIGTALPEHSRQLLVEGDFVTLRYKHRGPTDEWYDLFGNWRYFDPDVSNSNQGRPGPPSGNDPVAEAEALVLIQWHECQRQSMRRFILMLVNWIDDFHAERRGLLTSYHEYFSARKIAELPRIRKRFILQ